MSPRAWVAPTGSLPYQVRRRLPLVVNTLMVMFFVLIAAVGVLGVTGYASPAAESSLPSTTEVVLWCTIYLLAAVLGITARVAKWKRLEGTALVIAAGATALQAVFLVSTTGQTGLQTGARLFAGVPILLAIALNAFDAAKTASLEEVVTLVLRENMEDVRKNRGAR